MTKLILPNGNGESRSWKRGSDFVTMDELVKLLGPQAKLLMEFHERLSAVEAANGITPLGEDDELLGPNLSGDVD